MIVLLIGFIINFIVAVESASTGNSKIALDDILQSRLLFSHAFQSDTDYSLYDDFIYASNPRPFIACSSNHTSEDELNTVKNWSNSLHGCPKMSPYKSSAVYSNKSSNTHCYIVHMKHEDINSDKFGIPPTVELVKLPSFLKLDTSIVDTLTEKLKLNSIDEKKNRKSEHKEFREKILKHPTLSNLVEGDDLSLPAPKLMLSIEYLSCVKYDNSIFQWIKDLLSKPKHAAFGIGSKYSTENLSLDSDIILNFFKIIEKFKHLTWSKILLNSNWMSETCVYPSTVNLRHNVKSIDLINVHDISETCLLRLVQQISTNSHVLHIAIQEMTNVLNFEARRVLQSGVKMTQPYTDAGLTGVNQICGVADTGLHDLSCYFLDDSESYPTITTNRSGVYEPLRRKVVQYVGYADNLDERGGHGTHVSGSIVGKSNQEFSSMDGMAPDAKISFFDIGMTSRDFLIVPPLEELFNYSYEIGVRVHSNSWGNLGGIYGSMAYDLDLYHYEHPDFLALFAAGNAGALGVFTINSPANAKNTLTVGATQLRDVITDKVLVHEKKTSIASFSSIGPTFDGRIKPEVVAPGDYIMSAYAGSSDILSDSLKPGWDGPKVCSAHQMSGTSMATPVTAGMALLIRQFFQDPHFWEKSCNLEYDWCKRGAFTPTGYLLKCLLIHSGEAVTRYSDPIFQYEPNVFTSFLLSSPPDIFQGFGEVYLRNILPLLSQDNQRNILGLDPALDLIVFDKLRMKQNSTIRFDVDMSSIYRHYVNDDSGDDDGVLLPPLKVTIAWFDPPALLSSVRKLLLHDIDLVVVDPQGTKYWGNRPLSDIDNEPLVYILKDQKRGNTSSLGLTYDEIDWSDDRNPQEQVHVLKPKCFKISNSIANCIYQVFIHANFLPFTEYQDIAVVITTGGSVTGPMESNIEDIYHEILSTKHRSPDIFTDAENATMNLNAKLGPEENKTYSQYLSRDGVLQTVSVSLEFEKLTNNIRDQSTAHLLTPNVICPASLELTIIDPSGRAVAIGGADSSLGMAGMTTEWPKTWWEQVTRGKFTASVNVALGGLTGKGLWKGILFNAWSQSTPVSYNLNLTLNFERVVDLLPNNSTFNAQPSNKPQLGSYKPIHKENRLPDQDEPLFGLEAHRIKVPLIGIGVYYDSNTPRRRQDPDYEGLNPNIIRIQEFKLSGVLHSIEMKLDGYIPPDDILESRGSLSWLTAVSVTAPNELMVQLGGYQWIERSDRFYTKRWPDTWIGRMSGGQDWVASRIVRQAGLSSCPNKLPEGGQNFWSVDIALGYVFSARPPSNISGEITLFFEPEVNCSIEIFKEDDWLKQFIPSTQPSGDITELPYSNKKDSFDIVSLTDNFIIVLLAIILIIAAGYQFCVAGYSYCKQGSLRNREVSAISLIDESSNLLATMSVKQTPRSDTELAQLSSKKRNITVKEASLPTTYGAV